MPLMTDGARSPDLADRAGTGDLHALRGRLTGGLVLPGDPEWDDERRAWELAGDYEAVAGRTTIVGRGTSRLIRGRSRSRWSSPSRTWSGWSSSLVSTVLGLPHREPATGRPRLQCWTARSSRSE